MSAAAQLRFSALPDRSSHLPRPRFSSPPLPCFSSFPVSTSHRLLSLSILRPRSSTTGHGGGWDNSNNGGGRGRGFGGSDDEGRRDPDPESRADRSGPLGVFLEGWRARVVADPQFPFKVLMEELVGVSACVLGDMASRPNFGLGELDFVFSTLVVGSILNFVLMYLLAPTSAASAAASAFPSHMFEPGPYSLPARAATVLSKGVTFAAVGFAAGLAGTAISNGLIAFRKKLDPAFETPNKPPPTVLNALTWAIHMGVSSNLRYQTLNGVEYVMAKALPPAGFKASVVALRCLNNVLGGMSFVVLARLTGSQKAAAGEEQTLDFKEMVIENTEVVENGEGSCQGSTIAERNSLKKSRSEGHVSMPCQLP